MLTLRHRQTHQLAWAFVLLLGSVAAADSNRLGSGDVRDGYERGDYLSRSAALDTSRGERLRLAQLASEPPLGLPPFVGNLTESEVDLGRRLFFDRRLSANATLSCGMCHIPEQGFAQNEMATPVGIEGRAVRRNAPSLYNVAFIPALFHDGRESRLAKQVWEPLLAQNEMGNVNRAVVIERIARLDDYAQRFADVYAEGLTQHTLGLALASYERGLLSGASKFDRWYFEGDATALDATERLGFEVFNGKGCVTCHSIGNEHALFTDAGFHNTGIGYRRHLKVDLPARVQLAPGVFVRPTIAVEVQSMPDRGRYEVTGDSADHWRYRTPGLRNVALTAPYMHDGSIASLAAVIEYYNGGGAQAPNQDSRIRSLNLTAAEEAALLAFLQTLTGNNVEALAADARSVTIGDAR